MRNLDTNVLVRYLTADDARQLTLVELLIDGCRDSEEQLYLTIPVLCELVWVLSRGYGHSKISIVETMDKILGMEQFRVERDSVVRRSLDLYRAGKGDFSDYVIGEIGRQSGCRDTVTFDRALKGSAGFTILS